MFRGRSGLAMLPSQLTLVCGGQLEALAWVQPQHTQEFVDCSRRVLGLHHQHVPRSVPAEQREEGTPTDEVTAMSQGHTIV